MHPNAPEPSLRLLTVDEVGLRLGVSRRSLWKWIRAGRLPTVRLGERTVRIRESDVARFVFEHLRGEESR